VEGDRIEDEEVVYLRVPPMAHWFEPPDHVTTANFKLDDRRGDLGLSVYRQSNVTVEQVLAKADAIPESRVASATVGEIRRLKNRAKKPEPLNLDVIVVDDENDPGHAEIRGPTPGTLAPAASKALRDLFKLV